MNVSSNASASSLKTAMDEPVAVPMNQVSPTAVISLPVRLAGSWPQIASPPNRYVRPMARWSMAVLAGSPDRRAIVSPVTATIVPSTPMASRIRRSLMAGL